MSTQHLWDRALEHLRDLTGATLYREQELEERIAALESELSAMKLAYNTTVDNDTQMAHNVPLSSTGNEGSAFNVDQGYQGGRQAAQDFTKAIAQELLQQGLTGFERLSFWVTVFLNKKAVGSVLREGGICNSEQLESFFLGFGQASPRFLIVDVGPGRDSTEMKVKEYIKTYIRFPQTLRLFFGGVDEVYLNMHNSLAKADLARKLVLLQPPAELSPVMYRMSARSLRFDGLFMKENVNPWMSRRPGPLLADSSSGVVTNGGLISPQSESQTSMITPPPQSHSFGGPRPIDPTKPLHKQNPPPCNEHYLMSCSKGQNCKYSHDWFLTPEQLDILARNAKKAPCNYLKNGLPCPHGERCCWVGYDTAKRSTWD
ncbi:hypothetical protein BN946_scf184982.g4 [Trametes cinnabarina]|uniref:C3H1-type domain-containing protein n=1 Tax=Pycnoporus cinnabarinus TaxID=5643 RepID=A0A060SQ82_PYCCI|nr:hypothetical protein BN946_scf184982.g4 [Trametes cinnabarina]